MSIGDDILREIIERRLVLAVESAPGMLGRSPNTADQLDALVANSAAVQLPTRLAALYGEALRLAGAPDNGDPEELLAWARAVKK